MALGIDIAIVVMGTFGYYYCAGWAFHSCADSGYDSMHSYESSELYSRLASITELCHMGWVDLLLNAA